MESLKKMILPLIVFVVVVGGFFMIATKVKPNWAEKDRWTKAELIGIIKEYENGKPNN